MTAWLRRPTAWLPFAISIVTLVLMLGYAGTAGVVPHEDERAPARLFQLTMLAEAGLIALFAARWLPREPRGAAWILAAQVAAAALPIATIVVLESLS